PRAASIEFLAAQSATQVSVADHDRAGRMHDGRNWKCDSIQEKAAHAVWPGSSIAQIERKSLIRPIRVGGIERIITFVYKWVFPPDRPVRHVPVAAVHQRPGPTALKLRHRGDVLLTETFGRRRGQLGAGPSTRVGEGIIELPGAPCTNGDEDNTRKHI